MPVLVTDHTKPLERLKRGDRVEVPRHLIGSPGTYIGGTSTKGSGTITKPGGTSAKSCLFAT